MNILWITNILFPAPSLALGLSEPVYCGWLYGIAKEIASAQGINFAVATKYDGLEFKCFNIDGVIYYLLPARSTIIPNKSQEKLWKNVCSEFKPDIIHIHGTEFEFGLSCMRACESLNYIVSIQGLVSVISRYYYAGINHWQIVKNITLRDLILFDSMFQAKRKFKKRGKYEIEYLMRTCNVIGRTSWDYAHVKAINPTVNYHFCNESLRAPFYTTEKWDINKKSEYTIFLSQAGFPYKGLHQVLKAISLLHAEFDKINIRIAGHNVLRNPNIIESLKVSGFGFYLRNLIEELNIGDHVHFIGTLTEEQMVEEYKKAHIYICPSSIENSPNSLGEAQLVGVPVIASYVGGIPDMIIHNETGLLYRFEEIEMIAENIRKIFVDNIFAMKLSANGIIAAESRHNRATNLNRTFEIYKNILI